MKKIKDFIHRHENLEKLAFSIWSVFWIIRARSIFRKMNPVRDSGGMENIQEKQFISNGVKYSSLKNNLKVIILALRTIPTTNLVYFDAVFGHAFKKLGCDVKMLYCDGVLDSCDADTVFRKQKTQCFLCKRFGNAVKESLNLDCIFYRQYISDSDIENIREEVKKLDVKKIPNYKYLGINVGRHARTSAIRYFLFGKIDLNNLEETAVLREKLVYAMIAAKVASNLFEKERPDRIFMLHGMYSTWGPFFHYFRSKGVDVVVYENMLPRLGHFTFFTNSEAFKIFSQKSWQEFNQSPLEKEEGRLNEYLEQRFKGKVGEHLMFEKNIDDKNDKNSILKLLFENNYSKRYVIYPNVAWDASIRGDISDIFEDVFDWIDKTIEFFKKRKDYQLIIKPHPGELILEGCSRSVRDHIISKHSPLTENIVLLDSNIPLRAYDLITPDIVCLTYDGTIGLELATLAVPVIAAARVHYGEVGVVKKVRTLDEYLRLLEDPSELFPFAKDKIELAKKYAYFYFLKSLIRIPFYRDDKWSVIDWSKVRNTEELLSPENNVMKICQKIINREDIVVPL